METYQNLKQTLETLNKQIALLERREQQENKAHAMNLNTLRQKFNQTTNQLNQTTKQLKETTTQLTSAEATKKTLEFQLTQAYTMINRLEAMQIELQNELEKAKSSMTSRAMGAARKQFRRFTTSLKKNPRPAAQRPLAKQPPAAQRPTPQPTPQPAARFQPTPQPTPPNLTRQQKNLARNVIEKFRQPKKATAALR